MAAAQPCRLRGERRRALVSTLFLGCFAGAGSGKNKGEGEGKGKGQKEGESAMPLSRLNYGGNDTPSISKITQLGNHKKEAPGISVGCLQMRNPCPFNLPISYAMTHLPARKRIRESGQHKSRGNREPTSSRGHNVASQNQIEREERTLSLLHSFSLEAALGGAPLPVFEGNLDLGEVAASCRALAPPTGVHFLTEDSEWRWGSGRLLRR